MSKSRRWELAAYTARYAVFATAGIAALLAVVGVPVWVQWLTVLTALALVLAAWSCVYMALQARQVERTLDLDDVADYFNRPR